MKTYLSVAGQVTQYGAVEENSFSGDVEPAAWGLCVLIFRSPRACATVIEWNTKPQQEIALDFHHKGVLEQAR